MRKKRHITSEHPKGIGCSDCGGKIMDVVYVRHYDNYIIRSKQCRFCGKRIKTRESVEISKK